MRPMLVRSANNDNDIYINPKQIETIKSKCYDGDYELTVITFASGDTIVIRESVYDFIQELRKN